MNKACYYTPSVECLVLTAASTVVFHEFESKKIVCWMKKKTKSYTLTLRLLSIQSNETFLLQHLLSR